MTEGMKENDATRYIIMRVSGGAVELVGQCHDNEGDARDAAAEVAIKNPGETYAVFEKVARVKAELKAQWNGRAA